MNIQKFCPKDGNGRFYFVNSNLVCTECGSAWDSKTLLSTEVKNPNGALLEEDLPASTQ